MKIEDLIKLLNERSAEYIIIGAQALAAHGYVRATEDLDILINPTKDNVARVRAALEAFGYDTTDASLDDLMKMKRAAGRPQDLEDLKYLEEIKRQLKQK